MTNKVAAKLQNPKITIGINEILLLLYMDVLCVKVRKGERKNEGVEDLLFVTDKRDIEAQPGGRDTENSDPQTHTQHALPSIYI